MICEASEAVSWPMTGSMERDEKRYFRLQRFENICSMVGAVPCRLLHLDSTGPFWCEMERFLQEGERCLPRLSRSQ